MNIHLSVNNKNIPLTGKQIEDIFNIIKPNRVSLGDIPVGEVAKIGKFEFIVLEHGNGITKLLLKDFWTVGKFDDDTNDYSESLIGLILNKNFYHEIASLVGRENIVPHVTDLTSDDGRSDYGTIEESISLLTCDQYRKYVRILDRYNPNKWWWLATAYSTKNQYCHLVRCVFNDGTLLSSNCYYGRGVRPFCILKSNIFVSNV